MTFVNPCHMINCGNGRGGRMRNLKEGEVEREDFKELLARVEGLAEGQAREVAEKIGVSFDGLP